MPPVLSHGVDFSLGNILREDCLKRLPGTGAAEIVSYRQPTTSPATLSASSQILVESSVIVSTRTSLVERGNEVRHFVRYDPELACYPLSGSRENLDHEAQPGLLSMQSCLSSQELTLAIL
ncbi:MAG: hypothetical protein J0H49_13540 [Acidobacteria bacterium]|nr:hypothetical protein [Acidobacteriota bacterium]